MKNWKDLFVKADEKEKQAEKTSPEFLSFPVEPGMEEKNVSPPEPVLDPAVSEVLKVYEKGLDSINMPGYDFYEFYSAIAGEGNDTEQTYNMAYRMAKTMDKTITGLKLTKDAQFYISKINEVHDQYVTQGQKKLSEIQDRKSAEKSTLNNEIDEATRRINQIRSELQQLESDITRKKSALTKIDDTYYPQEKSIKEKLSANDLARGSSIRKLTLIKEGIERFIKD